MPGYSNKALKQSGHRSRQTTRTHFSKPQPLRPRAWRNKQNQHWTKKCSSSKYTVYLGDSTLICFNQKWTSGLLLNTKYETSQHTMPLCIPKFIQGEITAKSSFTWSVIYTINMVWWLFRLSSIWWRLHYLPDCSHGWHQRNSSYSWESLPVDAYASELAILLEATLIVDLTLTRTLIIQCSTLISNNYCWNHDNYCWIQQSS